MNLAYLSIWLRWCLWYYWY